MGYTTKEWLDDRTIDLLNEQFGGDGWHIVDIFDGTRPEDGLTWSENELRARYREFPHGQGTISCGYCRGSARSRSVDHLVDWFHGHDCA